MGNRLEELPLAGSLVAAPQYKVFNPHHKNSHRGVQGITVTIPEFSLPHQLLPIYLNHARPQLLLMGEAQRGPPELLLTNSGRAFTVKTWGPWWMSFQERNGAPLPHVTYHDLRHVFATDRLEQPGIPGPSNEGAAMLMNNTVRQWKGTYAPNARIATVDAAVLAGQDYRAAHLQLAQQQSAVALAGRGAGSDESTE